MRKYKLIILPILYLLLSMLVNIINPVTPSYVGQLNLSSKVFGTLTALMSLGVIIGAIIFGNLSKTKSMKVLIIIGLIGYAIGQYGFCYLNHNMIYLYIARIISGLFIAAPNTLFVIEAANISSNKQKVVYMGIMAAMLSLGGALGYKFSGYLFTNEVFTIKQLFNIQIISCFVLALMILVMYKFSKPVGKNPVIKTEKVEKVKVNNKLIIMMLIAITLITYSQISISKFLDYSFIGMGYSTNELANFVLITSLVGVLVNLILIPIINKNSRKSKFSILIILQLICAITVTLTFMSNIDDRMVFLYTVFMVYMICKALTTPYEQTILTSLTTKDNYGKILGIRQSFLSVGQVLAPFIGGFLYDIDLELVFFTSAGIFLIVAIFLVAINKQYIKSKKVENN